MKFFHLSDLHLGKRVNEFSMLEDQRYILGRILDAAEEEKPDGIILAGDIYDKTVPSAEAVELFDEFLFRLSGKIPEVFLISGNHDSPERISFGGRLLHQSGVHIAPVYDGTVEPVSLRDAYGTVKIWLLPFLKPANVRRFYPDETTESYTEALRCAVSHMKTDPSERNLLVTHQFVTGARRSDSEELSVGGTDNVDASVFSDFDYTALGHIHGPQNAGGERIRYCGSPLKYSFSEAGQQKSITVAELKEKGNFSVRLLPLTPLRDMRVIRGSYMELTGRSFYDGMNREDYYDVTLTDEEDVPDALGKLRIIYPNLMKLGYDNARTRAAVEMDAEERIEEKSPMELLSAFYEKQNGAPMSPEQKTYSAGIIKELWEEPA